MLRERVALKTYHHPDVNDVALADVMQALSDPCRLAIVRELLAGGELACADVPLTVSRATRSHHFAVLREAGIIATRTDGTRCMTSVREGEFESRFPGLLDIVREGGRPRNAPGATRTNARPIRRKPTRARA